MAGARTVTAATAVPMEAAETAAVVVAAATKWVALNSPSPSRGGWSLRSSDRVGAASLST
ncbi:hypothetical protein GCM10009101_16630 [Brevundimonas lenta]